MLAGLIGNAVGYNVLDGTPLSDVLSIAELNDLIDSWPGSDNDPAFDALVRERNERMEGLFGGHNWNYDPAIAAIAEHVGISYADKSTTPNSCSPPVLLRISSGLGSIKRKSLL